MCHGVQIDWLYTVAQASEFADHAGSAVAFRLRANGGSAFLIANALAQDLPDELRQAVSNRPNRFLVLHTGFEAANRYFEDITFRFNGGVRCLIENAAHVTVALRRTAAL